MVTHKEAYEARLKLTHYCIQHCCQKCIFNGDDKNCYLDSYGYYDIVTKNLKRLEAEEKCKN